MGLGLFSFLIDFLMWVLLGFLWWCCGFGVYGGGGGIIVNAEGERGEREKLIFK